MDDSRIPWWLVLLLGTAVAGLTVWQSSRWKMQVRVWACALALVYLGLLAFAIGRDPRSGAAGVVGGWQIVDVLTTVLRVASVTAAVLLLGRPSFSGQLIWFAVITLSNAGICLTLGMWGLGAMLIITGVAALLCLAKELARTQRLNLDDLWPTTESPPESDEWSVSWLAGVTGLLIGVALIGTTHYALHAESFRAIATKRHSAFPSRERIRTVLNLQSDEDSSVNSTWQSLRRRSDVAVLAAMLVFIVTAAIISRRGPSRTRPPDLPEGLDALHQPTT